MTGISSFIKNYFGPQNNILQVNNLLFCLIKITLQKLAWQLATWYIQYSLYIQFLLLNVSCRPTLLINETLHWDLPQHYYLFLPLQCVHTWHLFYDLLSVPCKCTTRVVTERVILRDTSTDLLQYVTISHFSRIWSCLGSSWHKPLNKLWLKENTNFTKSLTAQNTVLRWFQGNIRCPFSFLERISVKALSLLKCNCTVHSTPNCTFFSEKKKVKFNHSRAKSGRDQTKETG